MNKLCSKNRFSTTLSLLLLLAFSPPGLALEIPLQPFNASYNLYKGGMNIAIAELRLERSGEQWRWSSLTKARGIYKWFTSKQPYTETSFSRIENGFRLSEILIADRSKKKSLESARFDWVKGELEVMRKGKRRQLQLAEGVYDYQSIHLLAAAMGQQQLKATTIDFYRNKSVQANVYEQVVARSNSKIKYYYDVDNPLLPLRIERLESGESPAVLTLRQVEWDL
jgi:hypothetical protein